MYVSQQWFLDGLCGYGPNKSGVAWQPDIHQWITKAVRLESLQRCIGLEWKDWHFEFFRLALAFGLQSQLPCVRGDEVTDLSKADACLRCRRFFVSRAAWQSMPLRFMEELTNAGP